jgi:hypothetical protein
MCVHGHVVILLGADDSHGDGREGSEDEGSHLDTARASLFGQLLRCSVM